MFDFNEQIENQRQVAIDETRSWIRGWDADQREMVLWILEVHYTKLGGKQSRWYALEKILRVMNKN